MDTMRVPAPLTRLRRRHGLVRSPLCRRTDRIEAVVSAALVLFAALVVPLAVTVALGSYQRGLTDAAATRTERTAVTAILEQDPVPQYAPFSDRAVSPPASAESRWQLPNGRQVAGVLAVSSDKRAGDRIPIWVDQAGKRVDPPLTSKNVFVSALVTGIDMAVLGWMVLWFLWWVVCQVLNRLNDVQWEVQWARTGPGWNHRTSR
jgi:hypothetical protein